MHFYLIIIITWILLARGLGFKNSSKPIFLPRKIKTRKIWSLGERPIQGGSYTTIDKYPFYAGVIVKAMDRYDRNFQDQQLICGSAVVSRKWVMTSGSCLFLITVLEVDVYDLIIRTGATIWNKTAKNSQPNMKDYDVDSIHIVDDYITLGLMKITQEFEDSNIINVAGLKYKLEVESKCTILGYDVVTKKIVLSGVRLKKTDVIITPLSDCRKYSDRVLESQSIPSKFAFCAKWIQADEEVCFFEIGAPVIQGKRLVGIFNARTMCGTNHMFEYIKVSQFQSLITYLEIRIQERTGIIFVNH